MKFIRFLKKASSSLAGFIFPLLALSCSQITGAINEPVREYFEAGSTVTQIIAYSIISTGTVTVKDPSGNICVNSKVDLEVELTLHNPMNYTFTQGENLKYYLLNQDVASLDEAEGIQLDTLPDDPNKMKLTYPAAFLKKVEEKAVLPGLSRDISVRIELSQPLTGVKFPAYTLELYCNTAPPALEDAVIYKTIATPSYYVVCFTCPVLTDEQCDLKYLKINNTSISINHLAPGGDDNFTFDETTYTALHRGNVASSSAYTDLGIAYNPYDGTAFYYVTSDSASTAKTYTLSLVDATGLTSYATVSPPMALDNVTLTDSSGTVHAGASGTDSPSEIELSQDASDFYATVHLSIPTRASGQSVSGVTVSYTTTYGTEAESEATEKTSNFTLKLAPGTTTIKCTATKASCIESVTTFKVKVVATKVYVSSSGNDTTGNGSKEEPYKKINTADSFFYNNGDSTSTAKTIYLLTDLDETNESTVNTISNTDYIEGNNHTLTDVNLNLGSSCTLKNATIAGSKTTKKVTSTGSSLKNVVLAKEFAAPTEDSEVVTGNITLDGVSSTQSNVVNGNNAKIKGKIIGIKFSLSSDTKLTVTGSLTGSSGNYIILQATDKPDIGSPRVFTTDYGTYNSVSPASYFANENYSVRKNSSGEAELYKGGATGEISIYTPDGKLQITADVTPDSTTTTDPVAKTITLTATGTLEDGSEVTAPNATYFKDWNISVYYEYDYRHSTSAAPATSSNTPSTPLTLAAAWPYGNYVIVINVEFNGTAYNQEIIVTKQYGGN